MTIIDFLKDADPSVKRMTQKYLLDENPGYAEEGWISKFLDCFEIDTATWGGGIYGPKWVSTFYTLRDIVALEIKPDHPILQRGLDYEYFERSNCA